MGRISSYETGVGALRQRALDDAVETVSQLDALGRREQEAWATEQRINLGYQESYRQQLELERKMVREQNMQTAFSVTANALSQINPDDPTAEQAVAKWKGFAGQHLDSSQLNELFGGMDSALDMNRRQMAVLREKTGVGSPVIGPSGLIDWDATWEKGQKNLEELKVRTEKWGDEGRFLFHNMRNLGYSEYNSMAAASRSEDARNKFEAYQQAAIEAGVPLKDFLSKEDYSSIRKPLAINTSSVDRNGNIVNTDQATVVTMGPKGPSMVTGPGLGQHVYDLDEVNRWVTTLPPAVHSAYERRQMAPVRAQDLWEAGQKANAAQSNASARLSNANARGQELDNELKVMDVQEEKKAYAEENGTSADGGQPTFNFEP